MEIIFSPITSSLNVLGKQVVHKNDWSKPYNRAISEQ